MATWRKTSSFRQTGNGSVIRCSRRTSAEVEIAENRLDIAEAERRLEKTKPEEWRSLPELERVRIEPLAQCEIERLAEKNQPLVLDTIALLETESLPDGAKRLKAASQIYQLRVGHYRIVYQLRESTILILAVRVGHRRETYRQLP